MCSIRTERGSSPITTIFFANLIMLGILSALVCFNDSVGSSLNTAGQKISQNAQAR